MANHNLRVAIYARVSGEQQAKEDTIASQLEAVAHRIASDALECDPELRFVDTATAGVSWPARALSGSGTKPPPGPSTASTCSTRIASHASMPIRC
jgi:hypothetical protein